VVQQQTGFSARHEAPLSRDLGTQEGEATVATKIYLSVFAPKQGSWTIALLRLGSFFSIFFLLALFFFASLPFLFRSLGCFLRRFLLLFSLFLGERRGRC